MHVQKTPASTHSKLSHPTEGESRPDKRAAEAVDPHAVLQHPASPPRPNVFAFGGAVVAFTLWFLYLLYVATRG